MAFWQRHSKTTASAARALPQIVFFGGKGGVGKTTLAAATASGFAQQGERVLLISTDPAHSTSDLLETQLGDQAREIAPNFFVRELDPETARAAYLATVKDNIRRFAAPEFLQEAERQVDLSGQHPGVAESALFEALCQQLDEVGNWDRLIIDTAPTGHALHLLSLPESMQAWTEALLARQAHLADSASPEGEQRWQKAREVLEARRALFERSRKRLQASQSTGFVLVANDDLLSTKEGARARETLQKARIFIPAVIINRAQRPLADLQKDLAGYFPKIPLLAVSSNTPAPQGLAGLQPVIEQLQGAKFI